MEIQPIMVVTTQWMVNLVSNFEYGFCFFKTKQPYLTNWLTCNSFVECTADQQFVFEIRDNPPSISVDPTKLVIPDYPDCKPVFANNEVAIFKFGFKECGVRVYVSVFLLLFTSFMLYCFIQQTVEVMLHKLTRSNINFY